jgi:hypothetical protein
VNPGLIQTGEGATIFYHNNSILRGVSISVGTKDAASEESMKKKMNKRSVQSQSADAWKRLFGDALVENDPILLSTRLRDAKNAIMDRIEDSMRTASQSERRLLLTALNTLVELQRVACSDRTFDERPRNEDSFREARSAA